MASLIPENLPKFTSETLRSAAKQSQRCHIVPVRLRRAIKRYLREQEETHMRRKVLSLSQSFNDIKDVNLQLTASTSKELVEDPLKSMESSKRWKIKSSYGDIGLKYRDDQTVAYVASRMPAVYSACHRVLSEVRRRLPGFSPTRVLDFGAGTGSAMWAVREVWPRSLERINLVEPSQSMQRAGQSLIKILCAWRDSITAGQNHHCAPALGSYTRCSGKFSSPRISFMSHYVQAYVLKVLVEPGTPHGSNIVSQMRSHILWMEKRKRRKLENAFDETSKDLVDLKTGAFVVAPCAHDGRCPLDNTGKYCHFVQRLERTTSQRAYKRSKGEPLRGFEDEKFCFVAFRRGQRPRELWPLDGMKFETLKEQHAKRNPEDLEIDYEDQFKSEGEDVPYEDDPISYDSDIIETDAISENDEEEEEEEQETASADLGSGWGRIIYTPVRRGRRVEMDVCRATSRDGSEGSFERIVITQSKNPTLHHQARRSLWGDLWPF
ncbi:probable S-adenosyl-L-methionine-dependent RNA methyltransferase RSM22, mitochondrial isoform X2 [Camellia sinensis]|uniref:probable S-adenosyl-L-methionine-dependent RNA methyltransferase RSM22, mitochondrial isoform X2 n=1 Tax=Camellia sinensis TaxID=4442 RepID=UPI00103605F0|nr:probable S-adenosyl-L-methionine-dependent RNA methyltransferase RSM22, mitochondrial isoform X2 [Camellia sinensis]